MLFVVLSAVDLSKKKRSPCHFTIINKIYTENWAMHHVCVYSFIYFRDDIICVCVCVCGLYSFACQKFHLIDRSIDQQYDKQRAIVRAEFPKWPIHLAD